MEGAVATSAVEAHERAGLEAAIKAGADIKIATLQMAVADDDAGLLAESGAAHDALPSGKYSALACPHCGEAIGLVKEGPATRIEKAQSKPSDQDLKARRDAKARASGKVAGAQAHLVEAKCRRVGGWRPP